MQTNVWNGEASTALQRRLLEPSLYDLRIQNPMIAYGGVTGQDPNFGRNFATSGALLEGVVTDTSNRLTLALEKDTPSATASAGIIIASASANLGGNAAAGAHAFEDPNGTIVI